MLAGICSQLVCMIFFVAYLARWALRARNELRAANSNIRWLVFGIVLSSIMIIIRGTYRTIELAGGIMGFLAASPATFSNSNKTTDRT